MRYKIELRNLISHRPNNMTFIWIENNRWDQGNYLSSFGPALRIGRTGQGTVTSVRGQLQLLEGNNCILDFLGQTPILTVGSNGDGTYTGPPGILNAGAITWRVVEAN